MILELNTLAVDSFETEPGARELMRRPRATEDIILCAAQQTCGCLAGGHTNELILC